MCTLPWCVVVYTCAQKRESRAFLAAIYIKCGDLANQKGNESKESNCGIFKYK